MAGTPQFTIGGQPASSTQWTAAENILQACKDTNANDLATQAILFAAIMESNLNPNICNASNHCGVFQLDSDWQNQHDYHDTHYWAVYWLTNGFFGQGGGIHIATQNPNWSPDQVATSVEGEASAGTNGYAATQSQSAADAAMATVNQILNLYGSGQLNALGGGGSGATASSGAGAFQVGDSSNPSEDYWTAINRLCQEVNFYVFTRQDAPNKVLFIADGEYLLTQKPSATISLDPQNRSPHVLYVDFTWDNTAFEYKSEHPKKKAKKATKSAVASVTSPTECQLHLICDVISFEPGDAIQLIGCGPGNGPWLVSQVQRSCFQPYSELTLVPGIMPVTQNSSGPGGANTGHDTTEDVNATVSGAGSNAGAGSSGPMVGGVMNPAPGATWSRLDQGFDGDYNMQNGAVAPYNGKVLNPNIPGWPGQGTYFYIKNDDQTGPDYTRAMYFAEGATMAVASGQHVTAGTKIGNPVQVGGDGAPGNFEIGPADPNTGDTLAGSYGNGSQKAVQAVTNFAKWLQAAGAGQPTSTSLAGSP